MAAALPAQSNQPWEWRSYAGDAHASHFSPLDEITADNVAGLEPAWELETLPANTRPIGMLECTPIVVDGVMYVSAFGLHTHAVEAHTGKPIWVNEGFSSGRRSRRAAGVSRGVVYWKDGGEERIFAPVREHLFAIDAKSGKLIDSFGAGGAIELEKDIDRELGEGESIASTTPGVVFEDLLIVPTRHGEGPSKAAPGHIRAYDCRTGKRRWIFHTIPHPGEFGYETWSPDSWKESGGANCWGGMSVDHERGLVFVATGSPTFDFWGGRRKGQNLFGNCTICLDARTGERKWHFQAVHHDLWDYDHPCAPNLVTVMHEGRPRDAVAQIAKTGWIYLLDRETGEPLYPIEERPVPASTVPGEEAWPTQPFPTHPPPFSRQYFGPGDVANLSPESHEYLVSERLKDVAFARMFTPPRLNQEVICYPGYHGGGLWGGGAWSAEDQGVLYLGAQRDSVELEARCPAPEGAKYPLRAHRLSAARGPGRLPGDLATLGAHLGDRSEQRQDPVAGAARRVQGVDREKHPAHGDIQPRRRDRDQGRRAVREQARSITCSARIRRRTASRCGSTIWEAAATRRPRRMRPMDRQFVVIASSPRSDAQAARGRRRGFTAFALPKG